jgi:tRNA A37 threonylcarbamoyladenosine dehydratase
MTCCCTWPAPQRSHNRSSFVQKRLLGRAEALERSSGVATLTLIDLNLVTHDPLLVALRQRLRQLQGAACAKEAGDGSLNGHGSSVVVTATFGMTAASVALERLLRG